MTEPSLLESAAALHPWTTTAAATTGTTALTIIERPLAIFRGPPPEQGIWGWPDLIVQTLTGTLSMPGDLIDAGAACLSSAVVPPGFGLPAARLMVTGHLGMPHAHLPPPAPPFLSMGPTAMMGAINVLAANVPMLRTGDIGFALTCPAPVFKVLTGSASVFVGGKRAARLLDFTDHCPAAGSALAAIEAPRAATRAANHLVDAMTLAAVATGVVAHSAAAATDFANDEIPEEVAEERAAGEIDQVAVGVAQGIGDAALSAFHNLIGVPPPIAGVGAGVAIPTGLPALVLVGGLPAPELGTVTNGHVTHRTRTSGASAIRALRRWRGGRSLWCAMFGHPVDAVTGHVFADHVDVDLGGGLSFARHYDSRARDRIGDVGRGMRHTFERELEVWLHRCSYVDHEGVRVDFPAFRGRDRVSFAGHVIERLAGGRFEVSHRGETMVFVGTPGVRAARLVEIRVAREARTIEHDAAGRFRAVRIGARALVAHRDEDGRIDSLRDERGIERASYAYERACLVATRDAEGRNERCEYDAQHRLTAWRDARGYRFVWRYDEQSRCVHTSGEDRQWSCDFVYAKNATTVTHGSGLVETLHFDAYGTVLRVVRSDGGFLLREQDAEGRIVRERDAAGRVVEWLYDETGAHVARRDRFGRVLPPDGDASPDAPSPRERVLPTTLVAQLGLEHAGDSSSSIAVPEPLRALAAWALPPVDPPREPRVEHDGLGRVVRWIDARGRSVELRRDAAGNVVEVTDRDRRATRVLVTGWNLVGREIDPLGRRVDATYTTTEEVRTYRDPRGSLTEYGRDDADRLVSITRDGALVETYAHDAGGRLVEKKGARGETILRVAHHENALPRRIELAQGGTIELDYDARGRVTRASLGDHDARLERSDEGTVLFDRCGGQGLRRWSLGAHEVTSLLERFETRTERAGDHLVVRDPTGRLTSFDLRARGRVGRSLGNGTREVLAFDPEGRLEGRLAHRTASDGALRSWAVRYERSGEGDLLRVWDSARGERRFEIDAAHRLEAETDERGERHLYLHDAGDELALSPGVTLEHDARGRVSLRRDASGREARYAYDSLDQLVEVDLGDGGPRWRGSYDGLGRLRRFGREGRDTSLFWDGDRIAAELAHDGALRLHVYPEARALVPFAFVDYASVDAEPEQGRAYYVFHDASGMPTQIEDASGRTVWWADRVDPYGALTLHEGAELDYALRWPGHLFDRDLALHHNRFRAYDPALACYLQPDPLGHAGSPHSLYAYAPNPLLQVDLLGLTCDPQPIHSSEEASEGRPLHELPARLTALAAEWGVDPATGRFDPYRTMGGLSPAEVARLAHLPARAGEPDAVRRRRRHEAEHREAQARPMRRWAQDGFRANANREVSSPHEREAIDAVGAIYNNAPEEDGGQLVHVHEEFVDENGRSLGTARDPETGEPLPPPDGAVRTRSYTTRPDGVIEHPSGDVDIVEHKHLREGTTVLDDSQQLRAQREMASLGGGRHVIVMTSDQPLGPDGRPQVRPSAGAADGSTVIHHDTETGTQHFYDSENDRWCRDGESCD